MKINSISKIYKAKNAEPVIALNDVSFELPNKGMVFILGKSGSGKSTLLNVISGLTKVDKGSIEVDNKDITKLSENELCKYRNTLCGFIFQEYNLIPELNVSENIKLALQLQGEKNVNEKVQEVLKLVELTNYEKRKVTELSGGQKQRVAIARAIIKNPKIIFADEPTGALDEQTGRSILELLKKLSKDRLVIIVTHDKGFAKEYKDRIIELKDGKIINDDGTTNKAQDEEKSEWKKPKLPLKESLKIGCSNFKYHPIRLIATILLSVIAFTFLGVSLNSTITNPTDSYVKAIYENDIKYTALYKYKAYKIENQIDQSLDQFFGLKEDYNYDKTEISKNDVEIFKDVYNDSVTLVKTAEIYSFQNAIAATKTEVSNAIATRKEHYAIGSSGYIALNQETCDKLGFNIVGELPKNSTEIAINECMLNTFMLAGLIENDHIFEIKTATDIIGKKIAVQYGTSVASFKTIKGIVYTGCTNKCFMSHLPEAYHDKIIVHESYLASGTYVLCLIDANFKEFANAVANYNKDNITFRFKFSNELSDNYYFILNFTIFTKTFFLYISVIFFIFSMILLINFIGISIRGQMKQIGILSSLGTNFKELLKIYCGSMICFSGIVYFLSTIFVGVSVKLINILLKNEYNIGYKAILYNPNVVFLLIIVILISTILGSIIPLLSFRKYTPIDIINKGQIK